jgi:hypothetical protein
MKAIARKLTFLNGTPYRVKCGKKLFYYLELIFHKKLGQESVSRINVQLVNELLNNEKR